MKKCMLWQDAESPASRKTISDLCELASEIGYDVIKAPRGLRGRFTIHSIARKYDLLLTLYPNYIYPQRFLLGWEMPWLSNTLQKTKLILLVHDHPLEQNEILGKHMSQYRKAEKRILGSAYKILLTTPLELQSPSFIEYKEKVDYYGVLLYKRPQNTDSYKKGKLLNVVYIGALDRMKKAVSKLPRMDNVVYHFYGKNGSWLNHVPGNIIYHGFIDSEELSKRLPTYDVGLVIRDLDDIGLTRYIAYGSALSKTRAYAVAGLPIVVPIQYTGNAKTISDHDCGWVFNNMKELEEIFSKGGREFQAKRRNSKKLGDAIDTGKNIRDALIGLEEELYDKNN